MLSAGTVNVPVPSVTAWYSVPVVLLFTSTVAPGTRPSPLSTTTPTIDDVAVPCARAGPLMSSVSATSAKYLQRIDTSPQIRPLNTVLARILGGRSEAVNELGTEDVTARGRNRSRA